MKQLLEDYKRRLATAEEILETHESCGSRADLEKFARIKAKASCYRTLISELEKLETGTEFREMTKEEADEKCEFVYFEMASGYHIAIDFSYVDQVEEHCLVLPTGEVLDTSEF